MALKLSNNALSRLAAGIGPSATTVILTPGEGTKFPEYEPGDWSPATIIKSTGALEIIKITARAVDTLTIQRAQESTSALTFVAGDRIEMRLTAGALMTFMPEPIDLTWSNISGKPSFADVATSGAYSDLSGRPSLANVATSGSYGDLSGRPTLPTFGSAASKDAGILEGNLVEVLAGGKLPALDGSNLTGINAVPIGSVMSVVAASPPAGFIAPGAVYLSASYPVLAAALGSQPDSFVVTQPAKAMTGLSTGQEAGYGAGRWIVVGTSNQSSYSDDGGLTWTSRPIGAAAYGIAYGNGRWVAVGNTLSRYSTDGGATWTAGGSGGWLGRVVFNNGMFVAYNLTTYQIFSSVDGVAWSARVSTTSSTGTLAPCGTGFVFAGTAGLWTSIDGLTWVRRQTVAHTAVAANEAGVILAIVSYDNGDGTFTTYFNRSTDAGLSWQVVPFANVAGLLGYANGIFYQYSALAASNTLYASADGLRWKRYDFTLSPAPAAGMSLRFNNGKILAAAAATAYPVSDISYNTATHFYVPDYNASNIPAATKAYIRAG